MSLSRGLVPATYSLIDNNTFIHCTFVILKHQELKPPIIIEHCPKCNWLLRSAYMAQELLTTFANDLKAVTLQPSEISGDFHISIDGNKIFDRKEYGGFPEIKE